VVDVTSSDLPSDKSELLLAYQRDGFVTGHLSDDSVIDEAVFDLKRISAVGAFRTNSQIYSYNTSPRIVEAWRQSHAIHRLVYDDAVMRFLHLLYSSNPLAFSTINFLKSTEQPLHSDYVHFGTQPHFRLAAAWIALEDIQIASGPLQVVPGSHRSDFFCYSDLGFGPAKSLTDIKTMYTQYEIHVAQQIGANKSGLMPHVPLLKKGDFLIWDANLLHGSPICIDPSLSRLSQVNHYHFSDVELFYNPAFSQPKRGKFVKRKVEFIPEPQ